MDNVQEMPNGDDREKLIALYQESGVPATRLAEIFGISRQTLYNWIAAAGVTSERQPIVEANEVLVLEQQLEQLIEYHRRQDALLQSCAANTERMLGLIEGFLAAVRPTLPDREDSET